MSVATEGALKFEERCSLQLSVVNCGLSVQILFFGLAAPAPLDDGTEKNARLAPVVNHNHPRRVRSCRPSCRPQESKFHPTQSAPTPFASLNRSTCLCIQMTVWSSCASSAGPCDGQLVGVTYGPLVWSSGGRLHPEGQARLMA